MRFENAAKGSKRIFTAQVLGLLAAIFSAVTLVLTVIMLVSAKAESEAGALASGIGMVILGGAAGVLMIIGAIMNIVGIVNASKDEQSFRFALFTLILGVIASCIVSLFSSNGVISSIMQTVSHVCNLLTTLFIIQGFIRIADALNNGEVSAKGSTLFKLIACFYILILIADIIVVIFGGMTASFIAGIIALAAVVLSVVQYFVYLSFLAKAKKMLNP